MDRDEPESNVMTGGRGGCEAIRTLKPIRAADFESALYANSNTHPYIPRFIYVDRWNRKTTVESYFSQLSINIIADISY